MSTWQPPRFDKHQFAGRRTRAVSARYTPEGWETPGIAFADYQSMHVARRGAQQERRLDTPSWATNDKELREVVLRFCERRFYLRHRHNRNEVSPLTNEQRLAAVREKELKWAETCKSNLHSLIARQKAGEDVHDMEIQNIDSQILMARRGNAAIATAIVYLYYRLGWDSPEVAQELGIKPPLVRQVLARLDNAAANRVYQSPKAQRIKEARAEMKRVRDLFRKLKKIVDATERHATEEELKRIAGGISKPSMKAHTWTLARLRQIYFMRLLKKDWDFIAKSLGVKHGASVQQGFSYYMKNMQLLPDFKQAAA